ncbi:hypothetical protein CONCODRAFT_3425 [Conidiobolus coronatus NRRL 28638]|uniref:Zip-domain-containing protein n=1 Tax=Conidiobolus coronatus (strain ATCC 28846 / CBS 209.66 / NRRL 28638) TaxID=796925 RepID=A0A137PF24_CONC2|nr:hypothetical protein CONCODRAFT_3425 [Conidiobolus coronatus NRRL 28638]|eukprot:KXN73608.1 hypothetical protein CONCODRAFT_3425 [Conidiobolus coronatus NRRL 28638]
MSPMITCLTIATVAVGVNAAVSSPSGFFTSNTTLTDPMFSASVKEDSDHQFNTMLGFILVAAGSLVPALGALLLYMEDVIKLFPSVSPEFTITNNPKFLASILSFSVGVLICSIFLALIPEAIVGFEDSTWLESLQSERLNKIIGSSIFALFVGGLLVKRVWFGGHSHDHGCVNLNNNSEKSVAPDGNQVAPTAITSDIQEHVEVTVIEKELSIHTSITNNGSVLPKTPEEEQIQFKSMANRIMLAFFIHNIPEGLVTFLSVYESYKNGIIFTIALSLHKLPEGIMISVPVYYGYKKKWKAIIACLVCTLIPQLIGSLIAWASTKLAYDSMITGIMFLIATTILSETTFGEVIPMARNYDPKDLYTTNWILIEIQPPTTHIDDIYSQSTRGDYEPMELEDPDYAFSTDKSFNISAAFIILCVGGLLPTIGILICTIFVGLLPEGIENFQKSKWLQGVEDRWKKFIGALMFTGGSHHGHGHGHNHGDLQLGLEGTNTNTLDEKGIGENTESFKKITRHMGLALFIHNIPEGIVIFIAVFESYKLGLVFGIAMTLHKIPEGIMLGAPAYYAHGLKWKACLIVFICTWVPQMIGGLLGWASTSWDYDSLLTGILFLLATAILTQTLLVSLLPLSTKYDPEDRYSTNYKLLGIIIYVLLSNILD